MLKILTIIGARPQIIKSSAISRMIRNEYSKQIREIILHTGQHYNANMSDIFFEEMNIPKPDYQLSLNQIDINNQIPQMIIGINNIIIESKPDFILLYGDTNTTLAGSIAALTFQIPIIHIEAGLRSNNKAMPEELNRIYCDFASSLLFCPTKIAVENLQKEGISNSNSKPNSINNKIVFLSGDVMYDNALYFSNIAKNKSRIIQNLKLENNNFLLCTIHRNYNTDNLQRLKKILIALSDIATKNELLIIIPIHPRTKAIIEKHKELQILLSKNDFIKIIDPVSYFDMIMLELNSLMILTDSGGVQREAYFFNKASIILRSETEWTELLIDKNATIADTDYNLIIEAFEFYKNNSISNQTQYYGNGNAAKLICETILSKFVKK